ncbi:hypothetical protein EVAR_41457_1 [Eumeta japonica]|uniref:CARD domain-containing protein n=1 Tax=Eumeta variegata TaxID=151549 RepID=A0A4C1WZL7_EUMVA|nr:hypothetical protein EVAR_41457_1 [Eumeta japonica]
MQEEHRQAIQNNFSSLVEQTDLDTIVSSLYEKNVFSEAMIEPYKDRSKEERYRKRQLYRDIERRGPKAFQALIDTLTEIGKWDLVRALQPNSALHPYRPFIPIRPPQKDPSPGCGWESLMKNVTLGNVTMSHRTREASRMPCLSHSTMIGLPRAALEN